MRIAIVGSGGVGGYFGGKLAHHGAKVDFVARGELYQAMKQNGLLVKSYMGNFHVPQISVYSSIGEIPTPDIVIVAVKAWQVEDVGRQLFPSITADTLVLPLQNGVMANEELCRNIPGKQVLGGLCRILSKIESPGVIHHFGVEPSIVLGKIDPKTSNTYNQLALLLNEAGIKTLVAEDIITEKWKKFISICISGLLAVTHSSYGEVLEYPPTRQMAVDILTEGIAVANALKIHLPHTYIQKTMAVLDSLPYNSNSSLTRDIVAGRPSELDYQNGTLVKLGLQHGVPTPVNKFIFDCLSLAEKRARR